jgi:anti-sigma factor RsiW
MCDKELLIDYLYGELGPGDREAFERHLSSCADCREEAAGLRTTRTQLESWAPPQPDLGFEVVRGPRVAGGAPRRWGLSPAWGFAAAAMLVGAVSAAIANVEITTGTGGITVRTGWNRTIAAVSATQADMVPAAELKRVEARLRDFETRLAAASTTASAAPASTTTGAAPGRMSDADLVRIVRRMIEQSEERQQGVLAARMLQLNRDMELARRSDLERFGRNMEQIQRTNYDTLQVTKRLEDLVYRVGMQR